MLPPAGAGGSDRALRRTGVLGHVEQCLPECHSSNYERRVGLLHGAERATDVHQLAAVQADSLHRSDVTIEVDVYLDLTVGGPELRPGQYQGECPPDCLSVHYGLTLQSCCVATDVVTPVG